MSGSRQPGTCRVLNVIAKCVIPGLLPFDHTKYTVTYEILRVPNFLVIMQGTVDTLKHGLIEAQHMGEKDAEKHRREEARLQERHETLIRVTKVDEDEDGPAILSTSVVPLLNDLGITRA